MMPVHSTAVGARMRLGAPTTARPSGRTALAAVVAALVLGILGMHALATHGTTPAPAAPSMATTGGIPAHETPTSNDSHHGQAHTVTYGALTSAADNETDTGPGSGHHMGTMAMLCVVILAAAAMTLLVLRAVRGVRPLLPAAFQPAAPPARAVQWVRGTGPPHVWAFSVIRC